MNQPPLLLLVDDSRATRTIIGTALREYDCEIREACNGAEAWSAVQERIPDLIVLDITMPIMSGVEVLARLKSQAATRDVPVVMLTANANPDEMATVRSMGAADYITKLHKPALAIEAIRNLVALQPNAPAAC
jgi:CheY-like chemotaxis protein